MSPRFLAAFLILLVMYGGHATASKSVFTFTAEDIPQQLSVNSSFIFSGSDSLYLNGRLLRRNIDYTFDNRRGVFDLALMSRGDSDTLRVTYEKAPAWLQTSYGNEIPGVARSGRVRPTTDRGLPGRGRTTTDVNITGAKTFSFTARTSEGSDFTQSLDLKILGRLTPGLEISGSVSDRGYDPSYGTANSRISELDKINIRLQSAVFEAQIGDITLGGPLVDHTSPRKRVSGASVRLHSDRYYFDGVAARPKGRFQTVRFQGQDNRQGPYQIGEGSQARAIVPASEVVWLDGRKLERGANRDYTMDYPTARITFNVTHPIDSRSRVEIDFEPLATDYRGELYGNAAGAMLGDSAFAVGVEWLREGDDRSQPLLGELSEQDKQLLALAGDDPTAAYRSGVRADTAGTYALTIDSMGDSVFYYVGEGLGTYSVTFSYVGSGKGNYRFLGGQRYQYVAAGQADFLPIVIVSLPERTDYYGASVAAKNDVLGDFKAVLKQSRYDRNLFSSLDDGDNDRVYYDVSNVKDWRVHGRENRLSLRTRFREAGFESRSRLFVSDFNRSFLVPTSFTAATDERLHEFSSVVTPLAFLDLTTEFSVLDYADAFQSRAGRVASVVKAGGDVIFTGGYRRIDAHTDSLDQRLDGEGIVYQAGAQVGLTDGIDLKTGFEHDRRENEYTGVLTGTRYNRADISLAVPHEHLAYQRYMEDSLLTGWQETLTRDRVSLASERRFGDFSYKSNFAYQWLTYTDASETSFLGRVNYDYQRRVNRLTVNGFYTVSEESRNERGITWLEVEQGQGSYILDNGQYVPDPDGNYIQVEEILSDRSRVRRSEKGFQLSRDWGPALLRFNSHIEEELLPEGSRPVWWIVPFLSDKGQPYLFYTRRYDIDLRLLPIHGAHIVNLTYNDNIQLRRISKVTHEANDRQASIAFKEVAAGTYFEQRLDLFASDRDSYYTSPGNIDGFKTELTVRQLLAESELSVTTGYRQANSDDDQRSRIYALRTSGRIRLLKRGDIRQSVELYRQELTGAASDVSYRLTDNHSGRRGITWSVGANYRLKTGLRFNLSFSGRHSDDRRARITGRGELVAGF